MVPKDGDFRSLGAAAKAEGYSLNRERLKYRHPRASPLTAYRIRKIRSSPPRHIDRKVTDCQNKNINCRVGAVHMKRNSGSHLLQHLPDYDEGWHNLPVETRPGQTLRNAAVFEHRLEADFQVIEAGQFKRELLDGSGRNRKGRHHSCY